MFWVVRESDEKLTGLALLQFLVLATEIRGGKLESSSRLEPGDVAPRSGVYRVHHYAHRMPHLVIVPAGTTLPKCKRCGEKVRFVPMVAAEPIEADVDFLYDFAA